MLNEIKSDVENKIAPTVEGIVADAQKLVTQEIELAKTELQQEWRKLVASVAAFGTAAYLAVLAGLLFAFALVHLVSWSAPRIPLWGSYLGVAALLGIGAFALAKGAQKKIAAVNLVPQNTVETLKENKEWLLRKTSLS